MKKSSGSIANSNGLNLEDTIENILRKDGYTEIESKNFISFSQVAEQPIIRTLRNFLVNTVDKLENFFLLNKITT